MKPLTTNINECSDLLREWGRIMIWVRKFICASAIGGYCIIGYRWLPIIFDAHPLDAVAVGSAILLIIIMLLHDLIFSKSIFGD